MDTRAELAAALFNASATQAAAEQVLDADLRAKRNEIVRLRSQLRVGAVAVKQLKAALTAAEEAFVNALAARDRAYAREIAFFRTTVEDIAATPEGAAGLARFNAGDVKGALKVFDAERRARDVGRELRKNIESAADGRRNATMALEGRAKGEVSTLDVIERYEEVTARSGAGLTTAAPIDAGRWMPLTRLKPRAATDRAGPRSVHRWLAGGRGDRPGAGQSPSGAGDRRAVGECRPEQHFLAAGPVGLP